MNEEERKKNLEKGESYAEAWRRIRDANAAGFYFEVVTLCESIISDRLLSYIVGKSGDATERTGFAKLIKKWKELAGDSIPPFESSNLADVVDDWREDRNEVVHGLTKSTPGTPTKPLQAFLARAKDAAERGTLLADRVSDWHKKQLGEHLRTSAKGGNRD
jgi:hypothetical protein